MPAGGTRFTLELPLELGELLPVPRIRSNALLERRPASGGAEQERHEDECRRLGEGAHSKR